MKLAEILLDLSSVTFKDKAKTGVSNLNGHIFEEVERSQVDVGAGMMKVPESVADQQFIEDGLLVEGESVLLHGGPDLGVAQSIDGLHTKLFPIRVRLADKLDTIPFQLLVDLFVFVVGDG